MREKIGRDCVDEVDGEWVLFSNIVLDALLSGLPPPCISRLCACLASLIVHSQCWGPYLALQLLQGSCQLWPLFDRVNLEMTGCWPCQSPITVPLPMAFIETHEVQTTPDHFVLNPLSPTDNIPADFFFFWHAMSSCQKMAALPGDSGGQVGPAG